MRLCTIVFATCVNRTHGFAAG